MNRLSFVTLRLQTELPKLASTKISTLSPRLASFGHSTEASYMKTSRIKQHVCLFILIILSSFSLHVSAAQTKTTSSKIDSNVIYGNDDREDYFAVQDPALRHLADSTVALIRAANVRNHGETSQIFTVQYGSSRGLCKEERFYEQETAPICSGFLVTPDTIVTAGHCINTQATCNNINFVFDFKMTSADSSVQSVPTDRVFFCKQLVYSIAIHDGLDFAVVKLDRPVTHVAPLSLRAAGEIQVGEALTVMGHPYGLPLKIAGGANVRSVNPVYFKANLDTYGGNSGSAVFNSVTGSVEGILVRGERDFDIGNGCKISHRCADDACMGEDVTRIDQVLPYIQ